MVIVIYLPLAIRSSTTRFTEPYLEDANVEQAELLAKDWA